MLTTGAKCGLLKVLRAQYDQGKLTAMVRPGLDCRSPTMKLILRACYGMLWRDGVLLRKDRLKLILKPTETKEKGSKPIPKVSLTAPTNVSYYRPSIWPDSRWLFANLVNANQQYQAVSSINDPYFASFNRNRHDGRLAFFNHYWACSTNYSNHTGSPAGSPDEVQCRACRSQELSLLALARLSVLMSLLPWVPSSTTQKVNSGNQ